MEIKQRFVVRHPPDVVWDALADAALAVQCLPGAELEDSGDTRHYKGRMRAKLGPLTAAFSGDAVIERDVGSKTGTIDWTGVDGRTNSRAKARMVYSVVPENGNESTLVKIDADIVLTGALAQFGRSSIINDMATKLTAIFADNLQGRLNATVAFVGSESLSPVLSTVEAGSESLKSVELRPIALLLSVVRSRLARRLRRWADSLDPNPRSMVEPR